MSHILLIEDDLSIGSLLRDELLRADYGCDWVTTAAEGMRAFDAVSPDLVLLDLMLPDGSGFRVLRHIRARSHVPVIILTARNLSEDKVQGLDLGADDYVTKPFWNDELLARIRARLRRPAVAVQVTCVDIGQTRVELEARRVLRAGVELHLTPTEFNLLQMLVERRGKAVRRELLIATCLQAEEAPEQSLQTHISRLRRKLGPDGAHIRTVWGIGYRLEAGEDAA